MRPDTHLTQSQRVIGSTINFLARLGEVQRKVLLLLIDGCRVAIRLHRREVSILKHQP
jgi:hypothetical protein